MPPFGNLIGIPNYFDKSISNFETSAFNCGLNTESIIMKRQDLLNVVDPII